MSDHPAPEYPVVVVGGGWAGLATAVELCAHKVPVVLLESARQLGGRARSIRHKDTVVDNGQHLMVGAYQSMLTLMGQVQVDCERAFLRLPLTIRLFKGSKTSLHMEVRHLPAPFHLLLAIITADGLSIKDRFQALRFGRRLAALNVPVDEDISVLALLHSEAQTPDVIRKLWEPLCIATLNTAIGEASARIFIRVLQDSFLGLNRHSDLLIPKLELSDVLPRPCADYLERHGAHIELGQRVTGLEIENGKVRAVNVGERRVEASHVVLATPHIISRRLMSRYQPLRSVCTHLADLGSLPITTLYLLYPQAVRLPRAVVALEGGLSQWVFDRRVCGQPGMMAVVISGQGPHTGMSNEALTAQVAAELGNSFPRWPAHQWSLLLREKRATFCSRVGIDAIRPANKTPVSGLWLAGDYTDNGLPATLEGAVRSGVSCAEGIVKIF